MPVIFDVVNQEKKNNKLDSIENIRTSKARLPWSNSNSEM